MKRIILTGGGTAGHVTPNMALIPELKKAGYDIHYIGSKKGIERRLIEDMDIPYYPISSGKLRRYFDLKNFTDPFRVLTGYFQASRLMGRLKPDILFSKGGFVSVPVVIAAKRKKIPVIIHESDITPGLANKLSFGSASKVCCNFPETVKYLPEGKAVLTGSPIRAQLFSGDKDKGLSLCGFKAGKPVLLVMGGSLGSVAINQAVRASLDSLLESFQLIHLCGKGNLDQSLASRPGYCQFEYASQELPHLFAAADLFISRAGANTICEILALRKPNILIPLTAAASRGDQLLNAASFEKSGYSYVLHEEDVSRDSLLKAVHHVYNKKDQYIAALNEGSENSAVDLIMDLINKYAGRRS